MTDRQFDYHLQSLLRELKRIKEEMIASGSSSSKTLDEIIRDTESQLKRP